MTQKGPYTVTPGCAPAFTTFKGIGKLSVDNKTSPAFKVTSVSDGGTAKCEATKVSERDIVIIKQDVIDSTPPDRYGLTYGALLVPYKYHAQGDKNFSGSASVGGYLGFRQDQSGRTGLALQYIGFLGATSIEVPQIVNGESKTQSIAGVSYGVGILGEIKNDFNLGFILGWDKVGSSVEYINNNKLWVSVALGYSFSN